MDATACRRRIARLVPAILALGLVLAGTVDITEIGVAAAASVVAVTYDARLTRRARVWFHAPGRWILAAIRALPQMIAESTLVALALARQLAGRATVGGSEDSGRTAFKDVDAMTSAIAATVYPCLTPNTVAGAARQGAVTGRKLLDVPGHALPDDLARLS